MIHVLVTCPNMIERIEMYKDVSNKYKIKLHIPEMYSPGDQQLPEEEILKIIHKYDAWIVGDDKCTKQIITVGVRHKLKAVIKWGVGVDNIDIQACHDNNIYFSNTPNMFGDEVSDVAIGMMICLSRRLHLISTCVKNGEWFRFSGDSHSNKNALIVGFGNIGQTLCRKLLAFKMNIHVLDPCVCSKNGIIFHNDATTRFASTDLAIHESIQAGIREADYVFLTCSLNKSTFHLIDADIFEKIQHPIYLINVSRGEIINTHDVIQAYKSGKIKGLGLDVFEKEPVPKNHEILTLENIILGSHNGSNTIDAVDKTSIKTINMINEIFSKRCI